MTAPVAADDGPFVEEPVVFGDPEAFGLLTWPEGEVPTAVVFFGQGQAVTSIGPGRFFVETARRLAASGVGALRLDYPGVGAGSGDTGRYDMAAPFVDVGRAALEVLTRRGVEQVLALGSCYGGRLALALSTVEPVVVGVGMFPPSLRDDDVGQDARTPTADRARRRVRSHGLRILTDPVVRRQSVWALRREIGRRRRGEAARPDEFEWVSPYFLGLLGRSLESGTELLVCHGTGDVYTSELESGRQPEVAALLDRHRSQVRSVLLEGRVHSLKSPVVQRAVADEVVRWVHAQAVAPHR